MGALYQKVDAACDPAQGAFRLPGYRTVSAVNVTTLLLGSMVHESPASYAPWRGE
jgi:hypothetical protein